MATLLGTPYKRGKSDIINAYNRPAQDIEEGLAVVETTNVDIAKYNGTNGIVCGVMGHTEHKGASAVKAGQEVAVQLDTAVSEINPTDGVYVTAAGVFTNVESGNKQVNAIWCKIDDMFVRNDGIVTVGANARENVKCAFISFVGGM